jgi:hypothetical protein
MIVYLLHYADESTELGHYLGIADAELLINPYAVPHGRGWRPVREGAPLPVVADIWNASTPMAARALYARLRRQGSRRRLCSICSPGNARGAGRGKWERVRR